MGTLELRERNNWQTNSGPKGLAGAAEHKLFQAFKKAFKNTDYEITEHPKELKHLYDSFELSKEVLEQIFTPSDEAMQKAKRLGWGVSPDFAIKNKKNRENFVWRN